MIAIDSNLWIYYADRGLPEHPPTAKAIRKMLDRPILINTTIQMEVAHYMYRRFGATAGANHLAPFLAYPFSIDPVDEELTRLAIEILGQHVHLGIVGRDATILASMRRHDCSELWTHDEAFKHIPGLKVRDPCAKA